MSPKIAEQRKEFSSIRDTNLESLTAEDFDAIRIWLAGKPVTWKPSSPRPYQQRRLGAILQALNGVPNVGRARLKELKTVSAIFDHHQLRHGTELVNGDEVTAQQVAN